MSSLTQMTFRADPDLKASFDAFAKRMGVSTGALFNSFMRFVANNQTVPFTIDGRSAPLPTAAELEMQFLNELRSARPAPIDATNLRPAFAAMLSEEDPDSFSYAS